MSSLLKRALAPLSLACVLATSATAQITINEVDYDQPGTDSGEFYELYDGGAGNTSLDGYVLVFYNGSNGSIYEIVDLNGLQTNADGFYLELLPGIQNGAPDGLALFTGVTEADFDGTDVNSIPGGATIVDSLVYEGTPGSLDALGYTGPDLTDPPSGDNKSLARQPDGTGDFEISDPSPGSANNPGAELNLSFDITTVSESSGTTITGTIEHDGDTSTPLVVNITNPDPTELSMPAQVTIPGDDSGMATFTVTPLDDGAEDGDQIVTIEASAAGFFPSEATITVEDDGDPASLVINEVNAEVEDGRDANGNNVTDHQGDEFIELVNVSGGPLDISGWTINDDDGPSHVFPADTVIGSGCAVLVFGGGDFIEGRLSQFGNALTLKASTGSLNLNNTGDSITIRDTGGIEKAGFAYGDIDGAVGSQTRDPDVIGTEFFGHIAVAGGAPFSPGTTTGGAPFCTIPETLTINITGAPSFSEAAGAGASSGEVVRSGSTTSPLQVTLVSNDASEITHDATVTIPTGQDSAPFTISAVDDSFVDGDQMVDLLASAGANFVSGGASVTVEDDSTDTSYLLINEVDVGQAGNDTAEFIEIYDGGIGNTPLDGYAVVLFNGGNDKTTDNIAYEQFDLDGETTNADGYFVIGSIGVPGAEEGIDVFPISGGWIIDSGTRAVALYSADASQFLDGTSPASPGLVDAVIYGSIDKAGDLLTGFGIIPPASVPSKGSDPDSLSRLPNGTGSNLDFSSFGDGIPTPGAENQSTGGGDPTAFETWLAGFPGASASIDGDFDTLLPPIEWALGLAPDSADGGALPTPFTNGSNNLQITVQKGSEAGADPDTTFFAAISIDGINWSNTDLNIITNDAATFAAEYTGDEPMALIRWGVSITP